MVDKFQRKIFQRYQDYAKLSPASDKLNFTSIDSLFCLPFLADLLPKSKFDDITLIFLANDNQTSKKSLQ